MEIIFATSNTGKLKEVRNIFSKSEIKIISLSELGFDEEIEETGSTFEQNAFIKAETIYEKYKISVMADDSGLAVEQLNNEPGVYSARYAGENATYADNNKKLKDELLSFQAPHYAQFVCCAVFVNENTRISVLEKLDGEIITEFKGKNGFGYDPIFKPRNSNITLAEMSLKNKNKISHRARAFNLLYEKIVKLS